MQENEEQGSPDLDVRDKGTPIVGAEKPDIVLGRAATIPGQWLQGPDGRWWYRHNDGGYTINGWEYINGKWYYFDGSGWMLANAWINSGGYYYVGGDGAMVINSWIRGEGGKWYYVGGSGLMATNSWISGEGGKWYYVGGDGAMVTYNMGSGKYIIFFGSDGVWQYTQSLGDFNLLDSGKHLDWIYRSTKYTSIIETAAANWNNYKPGVIRKTSSSFSADVTIQEYYEKGTNVIGNTSGEGKLTLNTYKMDNLNNTYKINVVMHELGHALGLGHQKKTNDIMNEEANGVTSPTKSDKKSYDAAYNQK